MAITSSFLESLHYVPEPGWTNSAYTVLRAGKVSAAPDYRVSRDFHIGQDILYCVSGEGFVQTLGEKFRVGAGELVWIANEQPHSHYADPNDPWTLLWFRLDGPGSVAVRDKLFGDGRPRASALNGALLQGWFDRLFVAMRSRTVGLDLRLNQIVGEFLMIVEQGRWAASSDRIPAILNTAMQAMQADLGRSWNSGDLSKLTGVSSSHLRRLFSRHLRTSPHQWLVRQRLMHAQALIVDSTMSLGEIAEICGFCDVYHFSREFKQFVGIPPAAWRRSESVGTGSGRRRATEQ